MTHDKALPQRAHKITLEGKCIVDDARRITLAKFELYNGTRAELQAVIDRANGVPTVGSGTASRALEFYANPKRYEGPNTSPIPNDPFQPDNLSYRLDVTRDGGRIARAALENHSPAGSSRQDMCGKNCAAITRCICSENTRLHAELEAKRGLIKDACADFDDIAKLGASMTGLDTVQDLRARMGNIAHAASLKLSSTKET